MVIIGGFRKKGKENTVFVFMLFLCVIYWSSWSADTLSSAFLTAASTDQKTSEICGSLAEHSVPGLRLNRSLWLKEAKMDSDMEKALQTPVVLSIPNTHAKDTQGFWKCCTFCNNLLPTDVIDTLLYWRPKFLISAQPLVLWRSGLLDTFPAASSGSRDVRYVLSETLAGGWPHFQMGTFSPSRWLKKSKWQIKCNLTVWPYLLNSHPVLCSSLLQEQKTNFSA